MLSTWAGKWKKVNMKWREYSNCSLVLSLFLHLGNPKVSPDKQVQKEKGAAKTRGWGWIGEHNFMYGLYNLIEYNLLTTTNVGHNLSPNWHKR